MIDKMKKLTFLVTNTEYEGFIAKLRELGVVHIQQLQQGAQSPVLQEAVQLQQRFRSVQQYLENKAKSESILPGMEPSLERVPAEPVALLEYIEQMKERENALKHQIDAAAVNVKALEPWGEFDADALKQLAEDTGMQIGFYRCGQKTFNPKWMDECFATIISEWQKQTYFMTFSEDTPEVTGERIDLPEGKLSFWQAEVERYTVELQALQAEYVGIYNQMLPLLELGAVQAKDEVSLQTVRLSDQSLAEDSVRLMVGWVKADSTDALVAYLDESHIYYEMTNPAFTDDVPVSLTNDGFSKLFLPILKMYSLPNYNDIDPTAFFAPFFMLFFGLCMGDAGYGILILLVGLFLAFKGQGDMRAYGRLACFLGGMTVICGFATATVFGINISEQDWAWVQPLKPYFLNDAGVGKMFGYTPMMVLSVIIGLIQVLLGMFLKGCKQVKNYGWAYGVGPFSWFTALLSAILLFGLPACGWVLPVVLQYLLMAIIAVAALGIMFYNNPDAYKKNVFLGPLLNVGGGLWETYGMSTGLLGDLLSYIRLFALGLTGGVLGGVFNSLGYSMSEGLPAPANWLVMVIILLLGHGITFALSMISAFVHPMRLTFVEFFKNSDFSGGGKAYEPFKKFNA